MALVRRQGLQVEPVEQHVQRFADSTDLAAVAADIVEDALLQLGIGGMAEIDIDQADLAAGGAQDPGLGVDRLRDVAGKGQMQRGEEGGHGRLRKREAAAVWRRCGRPAWEMSAAVAESYADIQNANGRTDCSARPFVIHRWRDG